VPPELVTGAIADYRGQVFLAPRLHERGRLAGVVVDGERRLRAAARDECIEPCRRQDGKSENSDFSEHWGCRDILADFAADVVPGAHDLSQKST
jgi:hypothetical protein